MITIIICISYLLVGAIISYRLDDVVEDSTEEMFGEYPMLPKRGIIAMMSMLAILLLPIIVLVYTVIELFRRLKSLKK